MNWENRESEHQNAQSDLLCHTIKMKPNISAMLLREGYNEKENSR